jgi:hypothetical protein
MGKQLDEEGDVKYLEATAEAVMADIPTRCIVFHMFGKFELATWVTGDAGWGYEIKDEAQIKLQPQTAVVIIKET